MLEKLRVPTVAPFARSLGWGGGGMGVRDGLEEIFTLSSLECMVGI